MYYYIHLIGGVNIAQIDEPLRNLWFPTPDWGVTYETSFIVLGPVPKDNPGHITTGIYDFPLSVSFRS